MLRQCLYVFIESAEFTVFVQYLSDVGSFSFWRTLARGWWFPWFPLRRWNLTSKAGRAITWTVKLRDSSKLEAAQAAKADLFCHLRSLPVHPLLTAPYNSTCLLTSLQLNMSPDILTSTCMYVHLLTSTPPHFLTSPYISFQLVTAFDISFLLRTSHQASWDILRFPYVYNTYTSVLRQSSLSSLQQLGFQLKLFAVVWSAKVFAYIYIYIYYFAGASGNILPRVSQWD